MKLKAFTAIAATALLAASCAKESTGTPTPDKAPGAATTKSAPDTAPKAAKPEIVAPTEAIGANKAETLAVSGNATIADTDEFTLALQAPTALASGESAKVTFVVTPKKGWKLNEEFPPKLKVAPPDGVEIDKPNQGKSDAVSYTPKGASWAINVKASSAGKKTVTGKLKFAVCTETTCGVAVDWRASGSLARSVFSRCWPALADRRCDKEPRRFSTMASQSARLSARA